MDFMKSLYMVFYLVMLNLRKTDKLNSHLIAKKMYFGAFLPMSLDADDMRLINICLVGHV